MPVHGPRSKTRRRPDNQHDADKHTCKTTRAQTYELG
eukprot:CAMPEP_0170428066 /NCGR_PEP_ID=MMETSP0117_2-20130122/39568_1 /TAXON_ID=400756 /ORGANISM="Durinskia baltica, Strain CSIRO CS-38" /LENGTH=36 /DNA_ID= /DNA_START= /DNA_END= /DNA_ORIENTATION=